MKNSFLASLVLHISVVCATIIFVLFGGKHSHQNITESIIWRDVVSIGNIVNLPNAASTRKVNDTTTDNENFAKTKRAQNDIDENMSNEVIVHNDKSVLYRQTKSNDNINNTNSTFSKKEDKHQKKSEEKEKAEIEKAEVEKKIAIAEKQKKDEERKKKDVEEKTKKDIEEKRKIEDKKQENEKKMKEKKEKEKEKNKLPTKKDASMQKLKKKDASLNDIMNAVAGDNKDKKHKKKFDDKNKTKNKKNSQNNNDDMSQNAIDGDVTRKVQGAGTAKTGSTGPYDASLQLSITEVQAIRAQISEQWNVGAAAINVSDVTKPVTVKVLLDHDGSVQKVDADVDPGLAGAETYRVFVDSVIHAVYKASPLRGLSPDKYDTWHELELTFDPAWMMR